MPNKRFNKQVPAFKMGGGMMKKNMMDKPMMKKGGKIPSQLKPFVMAKKKKAKMKKDK